MAHSRTAAGKGFGNGMSVFAHQYDPYNDLEANHSADSVVLANIGDEGAEALFHREAVHDLLDHVAAQAHKKLNGF